jgi:hypothetical protein
MGNGFARRTNLASEWDQMMLAEAGNIDFTNQDHFIMVLCKYSTIDHICVGRNCLSVFGAWVCMRVYVARTRDAKKKGGEGGEGRERERDKLPTC